MDLTDVCNQTYNEGTLQEVCKKTNRADLILILLELKKFH